MMDSVLGPLNPHPILAGCLAAIVLFERREIELRIDPDGDDLDASLNLARELVMSLEVFVAKAKAAAAGKLLIEYNQSWRDYRRCRPDGSIEDVVDPVLTEAAFCQRLRLVGLAVEGSTLEFCFEDGGLFSGHSVFVTSFDGSAFKDTGVMLFG